MTKKGSFKNLSDDQLILLDKLLKKKDYSNEKKAEKSKQKLLKQINIEIYKRNDTAIWKIWYICTGFLINLKSELEVYNGDKFA